MIPVAPPSRRGPCLAALFALIGMVSVAATTLPAQTGPKIPADLLPVKAALEKYRDPVVAVRDGYFSTLGCIDFPMGEGGHGTGHGTMAYQPGAMGVHFLNPALIGPKLDPMKPQVLLYEWVGDRLQLTGAEWFMPTQLSKTAPTIHGQSLQGPMEGHEPVLPKELHHWDLHVWLWKNNPNGLFAPTNSAVKCAKGPYSFSEAAPRIVTP